MLSLHLPESASVIALSGIILTSTYGTVGMDFRDLVTDSASLEEEDRRFRSAEPGQRWVALMPMRFPSREAWLAARVERSTEFVVSRNCLLADPISPTDREIQLAWLLARGLDIHQIARRLHLSHRTVRRHLEAMRHRFGFECLRLISVASARRLHAIEMLAEWRGVELPR